MIEIHIRAKARCPRHPRFDAVKEGSAGVKAGCEACWALVRIAKEMATLLRSIGIAQDVGCRVKLPPYKRKKT